MDVYRPKNKDPRPKRRKDKDNPYEIFTVGIETDHPQYFMRFKDGLCVEHCLEIDKALFDLLDRFELDDLVYLNQWDRHYEQSELTEAALHTRAVNCPETVEETALRNIKYRCLHRAIAALPPTQRRRLILYYFGDCTYEQIAEMEGCTFQAVGKSIAAAEQNIKKFLLRG